MARILLVEDNEMSADMLARRLSRLGHEVTIARDGEQAVDFTITLVPELVLMDLSLPLRDGYEATRLIKQNPETRSVPVMALTAHALPQERARAFQVGCDDYETKPIDLARLVEKMNRLLNRES